MDHNHTVENNKRRRGELRIYLGAAPGVGKTFAMLGEAHRRRERGTDVVVGLVETHGRAKTAELLDGLEVVPRAQIPHRGVDFTEMDIDALLARAPEVAVIDELAHTNVPGSRNTKRWQDIDELLDAGVDVLSTVNVQHLESLNDVVERITGIQQQETVPDEVVRRAEQLELVDITPEALRRRLAHGNVYAAHKIDAALGNYFRLGNLTALRELALLWVADQVDVALQRYRTEQAITDTWEARERVVVAITGGPESETLIRRARRIALRAGAELLVVHILRGDGLSGAAPDLITRCRKIADDLGATFHSVVGDNVPEALLEFARGVNATQLVLGTSRRSRLARAFDEGIGSAVVQASGPIDVHMVTHEQARRGVRWRIAPNAHRLSRRIAGWAVALLAPVVVTLLGLLWRDSVDYSTDLIGYLLVTCAAAVVGGLGPALAAAFLGAGLLNYFFTPPYHSLAVAAPENVITLVAMVIVGVLVALVIDRATRLAEQAARARTEAALLASYARTVLTSDRPLARLLEKIQENFSLDSVALMEPHDGEWTTVASAGAPPPADPDEADADIVVTTDVHLALRGRALPAADRRVIEAAAGQAVMALRQQRMAAETAAARHRAETTELRTALLSAVGHDLRTPLTSIKAAAGSLRDPELSLSAGDTAELLATVEESADRLTALVDNLLDSSRLATGSVAPRLRRVGYYEIVARALSAVGDRSGIAVEVDEHLPEVSADIGLLERVVANLIDNAQRHGRLRPRRHVDVNGDGHVRPDEPEIAVRASAHGAHVELRVVDHGPGIPKKTGAALFTPFQRLGDRDATPGVGLGLSVAKGFIDAMGGTIIAEDTPGGGLTIVVSLPAYHPAST
ncbi:Osmosensitive K+ channel histidine kinase KdpD [Alloactinosynnema sp. L-07]|uniref:sensor histidine kinase n=1 Tax=Alloactinosynnema sp. L-07 TaxID=1653480 RepID=UPI00065EF02E|nr:sensor histidine kinase KdpD [Alloactinosynnema sp. L-07]CRK56519.1 Osmosensitive K+ channel histidine kinase KdpD [Alloactinosynnema sp. L-07]